jgi:hypothetical protein
LSDHEETRDSRELADQVFTHAVREVLLLRVAAHVDEGKHDQRQPIDRLDPRRVRHRCLGAPDPERADRPREVLE